MEDLTGEEFPRRPFGLAKGLVGAETETAVWMRRAERLILTRSSAALEGEYAALGDFRECRDLRFGGSGPSTAGTPTELDESERGTEEELTEELEVARSARVMTELEEVRGLRDELDLGVDEGETVLGEPGGEAVLGAMEGVTTTLARFCLDSEGRGTASGARNG